MNKQRIKFSISEADKALFAEMKHSYISNAEKQFFVKLKRKEQYNSALSNELLVDENDNEDSLYLLRKYFDTYLVGYSGTKGHVEEFECETLNTALSLSLNECVNFPKNITLWEWLRDTDYRYVKYNRNYDDD